MWVLLLNSAEQALQNKIKIHEQFNTAYNGGECDIGLLFAIMHQEATRKETQAGTLVQYTQLFNIKEDNDFDTYCTRMLDAVAEFASRMQAVDSNVVIPLFIHNLNTRLSMTYSSVPRTYLCLRIKANRTESRWLS